MVEEDFVRTVEARLRAKGVDNPLAVRSINPYTGVITIGVYPGLGGADCTLFRGNTDQEVLDQILQAY